MSAPSTELPTAPILRAQIRELRQELAETTDAYQAARKGSGSAEVVRLLRHKSELVRRLIEAQSQLLMVLRAESHEAAKESLAETP